MGPLSPAVEGLRYQRESVGRAAILNREFKRTGWDSNPRDGGTAYALSRRAPSTTRPPVLENRNYTWCNGLPNLTRVPRCGNWARDVGWDPLAGRARWLLRFRLLATLEHRFRTFSPARFTQHLEGPVFVIGGQVEAKAHVVQKAANFLRFFGQDAREE